MNSSSYSLSLLSVEGGARGVVKFTDSVYMRTSLSASFIAHLAAFSRFRRGARTVRK